MRRALLFTLVVAACAHAVVAAAPPRLEIDDLARDGRWIARGVSISYWSDDNKTLYYSMQGKTRLDVSEQYAVDRDGGDPRLISQEDQWRTLPPAFTSFGQGWYDLDRILSPDRKFRLAVKDGNLYRIELATGKGQVLWRSAQGVGSPRYVLEGQAVAFQQGMNIFVLHLDDRSLRQVTDFRTGTKPREPGEVDPPKTEQEKYLQKQQLELFEYLRTQKALRDRNAELEKQRRKVLAEPEPYYIPSGKRIQQQWLSPDATYAFFVLVTPASDVRSTIIPRYVTESGFTDAPEIRPKVGHPQDTYQLGTYRVSDGQVTFPKFVEDTDALDFAQFGGIQSPLWTRDGKRCVVPVQSADYKTRRLLGLNFEKGTLHLIDEYRDPAWVGGPAANVVGWMPDEQRVYFVSEADGWAHLYTVEYDGRFRKQLTQGPWEVRAVRLARDGKSWLLVTSQEGPERNNVYRLPLDGGALTLLTGNVTGAAQFLPSPDEETLACLTSTTIKPYDVVLLSLDGSGQPRVITDQTTEEFKKHTLIAPRLVKTPDGHGGEIYALLWVPPTPDPKRPAIVHVHGAGYAQAVTNRWLGGITLQGSYFAQRGYFYLEVDYLGSAGYGRNVRTAVYRSMGGADVDSTVAAAQWLVDTHRVDPTRIGLYGGSYGGFLTLMCQFQNPGAFAAGVAVVPVSDWAHYNHWYTSRILNLPFNDDEAYRRSSPIYHAEGLADRLLLVDGLVDDNVHTQDTWRLMQRLIELHKTGWDAIIYPVEGHGFGEEHTRWDYFHRMSKFYDEVLKR